MGIGQRTSCALAPGLSIQSVGPELARRAGRLSLSAAITCASAVAAAAAGDDNQSLTQSLREALG